MVVRKPRRWPDARREPTNNRRRGADSTLLVSFCNMRSWEPSLAAINLRTEALERRWIDVESAGRSVGSRGLCYWRGLVCVAHEPGPRNTPPAGFVLLDPDRGFRKVGGAPLPSIPHSVCSRDGDLYFTMSREDSVYRARYRWLRGWSVGRYWTLPGSSGTEDENHVNAIEVVGGDLCVSATGRKRRGSNQWSSAAHGFVYNLDRADYALRDVMHPHSLLEDSGDVWTCETRKTRLVSTTGEERTFPGGPETRVRGLAMDEHYFYVGVSKDRVGSRSQGTLRAYTGSCLVYRSPRKEPGGPQVLADFSRERDEIYELLLA